VTTWDDGTPKSTDNAFNTVYKPEKKPTWSQRLSNYKKSSMHHSQRVTKLVAEGKSIGTIPGLGAKVAPFGGAYSKSKPSK